MPQPPNMALQRTRRPRIRSGRSLRSLGSSLNAYPFGVIGTMKTTSHRKTIELAQGQR